MGKFFELVGYEYKKMLMPKFSRIAVIIAFAATIFIQVAVSQTVGETERSDLAQDRDYARKLAGQPLTHDLLITAITADPRTPYREVLRFWAGTQAFQHNMPYIDEIIEAMGNFYPLRHEQTVGYIRGLYERNHISTQGLDHMLRLNESISEPWAFYFTRGYNNFFTTDLIMSVIIAFVIAVCVAPIFAHEHSTNVAQLIHVSKYGKSKLIRAKIFAAVSFGLLAGIVLIAVSFFVNMAIYGFDGAAAPFQLYDTHSPFPLTMGRAALIYVVYAMLRMVMFTAVLVFISAKCKSSFPVMIFAVLWIIGALVYFPVVSNLLRLFFWILPQISAAFSIIPYELFGVIMLPYVFEPLVAVAMGLLLLPFAGRAFAKAAV